MQTFFNVFSQFFIHGAKNILAFFQFHLVRKTYKHETFFHSFGLIFKQ